MEKQTKNKKTKTTKINYGMSTLPPIDPILFDTFLRDKYFQPGQSTEEFFDDFTDVHFMFMDATQQNQQLPWIDTLDPLQWTVTWEGILTNVAANEQFIFKPVDAFTSEMSSIIDPFFTGDYKLVFDSTAPRTDIDPSILLLRCNVTLSVPPITPGPYATTTVKVDGSAVTTLDGFLNILSIPSSVYNEYTQQNDDLFVTIVDRLLKVQVNVQVAGKAWIGISKENTTTTTNTNKYVDKGYVHHVPFQQLKYEQPQFNTAEPQFLTFDISNYTPSIYKLELFDSTHAVIYSQRFHSKQTTLIDPVVRPVNNKSTYLSVGVVPLSSTENVIKSNIIYQSSDILRDTIIVRTQTEQKLAVTWAYVSHSPNDIHEYVQPNVPPAPGVSTTVDISTILKNNSPTSSLPEDYYDVLHLNNGVVVSSVEIYSGEFLSAT